MIRVLVADDQQLVRRGIQALLGRAKDIQLVGEARDGQEAVELVQRTAPDVVTMDIQMPRLNGLEATRLITATQNAAKVVVVAASWDDDLIQAALQRGISGYVAKPDSFSELVLAIRAVNDGKAYYSVTISQRLPGAGGIGRDPL